MAKLVSKIYGDALFEVAVSDGAIDSLMNEVETLLQIFHENEEYVKLMNHPKISVEEKLTILNESFKEKVSDDLMGLLTTVVEKGRFDEIESILEYFMDRVREYKKIGTAHIVSAVALSDEEKANIENKLLETTSYETFRLDFKVDSSLIGGMIIKIGDRVVDSSIRTKLDNIAKNLSKIQLS